MRHLLPFLETREIKEAKEEKIQAVMLTLKRAWDVLSDDGDRANLDEMYQTLNEEWLFLRQNKEWMFNFKSGGWNTMMAGDKQTAIERAKEEYKRLRNCEVNPDTFRLVDFNQKAYKMALASFY